MDLWSSLVSHPSDLVSSRPVKNLEELYSKLSSGLQMHTHTHMYTYRGHLCSRPMLSALLMPSSVSMLSKKLEEHSYPRA